MAVEIQSMIIAQYMKELFKDPKEQKRSELSIKTLERADDLSDLSLLTSMLKGASTENEFNLLTQTNKEVQKRAVGKDPVIQAKINSAGLQIQEDTTLYNQFKTATKLANGLMREGEFEDIDMENMSFEDIAKQTTKLRRIQHMMNLGGEKGYKFTPEGERYNSTIIKSRLDEHSGKLDAATYFLIDKGKGKNLPDDAKRAIQVGDLATLKEIKGREITNAKSNYTTHSSRYSSLNNAKMQADTKKNVDGTLNLMPAIMMQDLKNQGEGQLSAYMEAIKGDPMLLQAFMGGAKSGSGITVDYDT